MRGCAPGDCWAAVWDVGRRWISRSLERIRRWRDEQGAERLANRAATLRCRDELFGYREAIRCLARAGLVRLRQGASEDPAERKVATRDRRQFAIAGFGEEAM